jgi:hypothetical protein
MLFALLGDIVSSKKVANRVEIQQKLSGILQRINSEYEHLFYKKLFITLGDEFQGVFKSFDSVLEIIHIIEIEMKPIQLRFGIGFGEISFDYGSIDSPFESDGVVWWNARESIQENKRKHETNKQEVYSNITINTNNAILDNILNSTLDICYSIKSKWTIKQQKVIDFIIKKYGLNDTYVMTEVATHFNDFPSSIFEKLKAARYANYVKVFDSIRDIEFLVGELV